MTVYLKTSPCRIYSAALPVDLSVPLSYICLYERPGSISGTQPVMTRVIDAALIPNDTSPAVITGQPKNGLPGQDNAKYERVVYFTHRTGAPYIFSHNGVSAFCLTRLQRSPKYNCNTNFFIHGNKT